MTKQVGVAKDLYLGGMWLKLQPGYQLSWKTYHTISVCSGEWYEIDHNYAFLNRYLPHISNDPILIKYLCI